MKAIRISRPNLKIIASQLGMEEGELREKFIEQEVEYRGFPRYMIFDFPIKDSDAVLAWMTMKQSHFKNLYDYDEIRIETDIVDIKKTKYERTHIREEHEDHDCCDSALCL